MHSTDFPRHKITVHHNGDFSGDAKITFYDRVFQLGEFMDAPGDSVTIDIPCAVLTAFGGQAMLDKVIGAVEGLIEDPAEV